MDAKYIARVVKIVDPYTVVVNKGTNARMAVGSKFLIVGVGETIVDPETKEELEQLEILKGKVEAIHVQEKLTTLKSCQLGQRPDKKEITKTSGPAANTFAALLFSQGGTVTESVTPGETFLLELKDVQIGDFIVKA